MRRGFSPAERGRRGGLTTRAHYSPGYLRTGDDEREFSAEEMADLDSIEALMMPPHSSPAEMTAPARDAFLQSLVPADIGLSGEETERLAREARRQHCAKMARTRWDKRKGLDKPE